MEAKTTDVTNELQKETTDTIGGKGRTMKEKKPIDKKKKKKIIRRFVVGGVLLVFVFLGVNSSIKAKNAGLIVRTASVTVQDIEQTLNTSGTVKSDESKTYFAPLSVKIGTVNVAAGDSVRKGQPLITYDADALNNARQMEELKLQASEGGYESSVYQNNKYIAQLGEASVNLAVLEQQIADSENYVKELQQKINDKKAFLAYEGTLLQISLLDWADKPDSEEYLNLQKLVQYNSYEQQNNKDILAWQKEMETYEEMIAAYKEYRSEMKAQKSSAENGYLDDGGKIQMEANAQIERFGSEDTLVSMEEVKDGIRAEFNGVVTEVGAVEGAAPQRGEKLVTVESTDKVKLEITVSKYDLEKIQVGQTATIDIAGRQYNGRVAKIDGMATTNASGAAVVGAEIEIDNPDSGIYLGIEARVEIHTAKATGVVALPVELINSDKDGDFVYVAEDGVVVKRRITTGISSDSFTEVTDGLAEGAQVIVTTGQDLEEGMTVTVIPQQ